MPKPNPGPLMKKKELLDALFSKWNPVRETEIVSYEQANGRVLARSLYSLNNIPFTRSSRMDGIALNYDAYEKCGGDVSSWHLGREFVRADTGDDFDDAYDTVLAIEEVTISEEKGLAIHPNVQVKKGMNVAPSGATLKKGALLLAEGEIIRPERLAAIVSGGHTRIPVVRRPKVAFLPTGTELVPIGTPLERGKNINSNALLVKLLLEELGAEPVIYPITIDDRQQLLDNITEAIALCDIVLINGGSSKGSEDFNTALLRGGDFITHGVAAVPGRPLSASVMNGTAVINVPGPALAAWYACDWCVKPVVCHYLGIPVPQRRTVQAVLTQDLKTPPMMEMCVRVNVTETETGYAATPVGRGEGLGRSLTTNGQYISQIGQPDHPAGSVIPVELLV